MKKEIKDPGLSRKEMMEFEEYIKNNMKRGYFSALGILGSHDLAMELSQEAFIRAYKNYKKFDRSKKFFTWYYRILKNLCLNYIRDHKKFETIDFLELNEPDPSSIVEIEEEKRMVEESLNELNIEDREIITLREFENLSYNEIAECLEIPEGSVMSRLYYARKKLSIKLKEKIK